MTTKIIGGIAVVHSDTPLITDFSGYTSKPLCDYIYECNNGEHLNFVESEDEAIRKLECRGRGSAVTGGAR